MILKLLIIIIKVEVDKGFLLNSWVFLFTIPTRGLCVSLFGPTFFPEINLPSSLILKLLCRLPKLLPLWLSSHPIIIIEPFHRLFELFSFNLLLFLHLFDLLLIFLLICIIIKVDLRNGGEVCWRLGLKLEEFWILVLAEPWMG